MRDILAWALATEILGLAVLPLLRAFFGNRRDAALLSRPLGLAVVAYVAWALSLLTPFGFQRFTAVLALALVGGAAWLARRRSTDETMKAGVWGDEEKLAAACSGARPRSSSSSGRRAPRSSGRKSSWTWRS